MLRITVEESGVESRLLVEGRLEEALVPELEKAFAARTVLSPGRPVVVDLSGMTGMDEAGELSLRRLFEQGATLRCADVMNTYLVERMAAGPVKPSQVPCRPCHSNEKLERLSEREEK